MTLPEKPQRRARGRPVHSAEQISDMRAHIAACALKLFQQEGYAAISMRRLAQEAGCTAMTLYKYYDSKFDILSSLWAEVFDRLFNELDRLSADKSEPEARLYAVALGYVSYWLENRDHYFMVFMSGGVSQSDVSGFVTGSEILGRFDLFRAILYAALGDNGSSQSLNLKAELLTCILNGIAHNVITIGGYPWSNPEKLVRQAIDGLLAS